MKKSSKASNKGSGDEDFDKESSHNEESDDGHILRKDSVLGSMFAEHIQSLIANAVMAQLDGGSRKINLYRKPYTKTIGLLRMPMAINPPSLISSMGKGTQATNCPFHRNIHWN